MTFLLPYENEAAQKRLDTRRNRALRRVTYTKYFSKKAQGNEVYECFSAALCQDKKQNAFSGTKLLRNNTPKTIKN